MINDNKSCCEECPESNIRVEKNNLCPICDNIGSTVKNITVKHLVLSELSEQVGDRDYYLCMNEECDVAYYTPCSCVYI